MKPNTAVLGVAIVLVLAVDGCGYFNSLYNARKEFGIAERQRRQGEVVSARQSYTGSIEKAAKSYRRYPTGRWSDDALYLIARARFQIGEYPAARAAFRELLTKTTDGDIRAGAHAYAGATETSLAAPVAALAHLDTAIAMLGTEAELSGFAHLWRARARALSGDREGAWSDLGTVTSASDPEYGAIQLERIRLAIDAHDSTQATAAFAGLLRGQDVRRQLDTIAILATHAASVFGAVAARAMLAQPGSELAPPARDSLALVRAQLASFSGDTLSANRELLQLASRASVPTAAAARVLVARSRLLTVAELEGLSEVRALLLPAIAMPAAQALIRTIRLVDVLVEMSAARGQPLALFTAGEIARDELGAPLLARKLFVTFADVAHTPWAGKALLAAIAVAPSSQEANALRARLAELPPNPYTSVTRGENALEAYETAEERLTRSVLGLREEAVQLAAQQETGVMRAIARLDSIAVAARTDTLRIRCGVMLDTLALKGVRADSVRNACMRRDSTLVATYLKVDTATWLPGAAGDSMRTRLQRARRTPTSPAAKDSIR